MDREERARLTEKRLEAIPEIPALPPALLQVWDLTSRAETSAEDLGRAMSSDAGLTGAVLRLANSAYFGFPRKVATVTQAIVVLGFQTVRSLATGASVFRELRAGAGALDAAAFYHHSLFTAMGARTLLERLAPRKGGTAFSAGILHDLGKLVIGQHLADRRPEIAALVAGGTSPLDAEREVLGISHAEIGAWFARRWSFPGELTAAVLWHHRPDAAREHGEFASAVHLADVIAHRQGADGGQGTGPTEPCEAALQVLRLDDGELERIEQTLSEMVIDGAAAESTLGV